MQRGHVLTIFSEMNTSGFAAINLKNANITGELEMEKGLVNG